jgi:hypothetical protein
MMPSANDADNDAECNQSTTINPQRNAPNDRIGKP